VAERGEMTDRGRNRQHAAYASGARPGEHAAVEVGRDLRDSRWQWLSISIGR
jgi:hypothetical protein